jgi:hypothetical protein
LGDFFASIFPTAAGQICGLPLYAILPYYRNQRFFERAARKGRSGELPNNDKAIGSTDNAKADNAGAGDAGADDAKADNARTDNAKAGAPRISVHPKGRIFPQQKSKCQKKLKIRQTHPS